MDKCNTCYKWTKDGCYDKTRSCQYVEKKPVIKGKWIIGTTAKTFDILHFVADNAGLSTLEAIEKAYNMGVSEQEPILDKIRAEIDVARFIDKDTKLCKNANASGLEVAMQIIDKYKAESEDKE